MANSVHNDVLDAALNYIKNNATRICVCSTQPTTYAEAITTYMLAIKTISSSDFTGPADGDVSGRKLTSNAHAGVTVSNNGTALHLALCDSATSKLLYVKTCNSLSLTAALCNIPAWDIEIEDPT